MTTPTAPADDGPAPPASDRPPEPAPTVSRRRLVQIASLAGGAAVAVPVLAHHAPDAASAAPAAQASPAASPVASPAASSALPPNVPPWMRKWGPLASPYGERSPFEQNVVRKPISAGVNSLTPLQDLHGTITPNSLFFERTHAGIPQIDPAQHRLMIHGQVGQPTLFTLDDLRRYPAVSAIHFHECSGNSGSEWTEASLGKTVQDTHGLLSCTEWTGVPVATVLRDVGWKPGGTWLLCEGADAAGMTRSVPTEKAMADGLLAYAQNGEAIRPSQGYPLRLILPGWEGNINIKWLRRIEVGTRPWETREETSKYTDLMPDGSARQFTFVMEAKSVIIFPSAGQTVPESGFWEISGLAWSGHGRITAVDISTDGGKTWTPATLQKPVRPISLTRFRFPWRWDGTPALLQSRAVDETGYVQPTLEQLVAARGTNSGYHFNAIKTWAVAASGEVTNVYR